LQYIINIHLYKHITMSQKKSQTNGNIVKNSKKKLIKKDSKKKLIKKDSNGDAKKDNDDAKKDNDNTPDINTFDYNSILQESHEDKLATNTPDKKMPEINKNFNIGDYSIDEDELFLVGDAEIEEKGLVYHHISSANDLYKNGIPHIITKVFKAERDIHNQRDSTDEDKEIVRINVVTKFTDVFISRPTTINYFSGKEEILYPNAALLSDKTYSASLRINSSIKAIAYKKDGSFVERTAEIKNFKLCKIPVMKGSVLDNTYGLSDDALIKLGEDPSDQGGYFIIKGVEWVIDCTENILFNQIRIFKNEGYSKEVIHADFISKPGDEYQNSDMFVIRLLNDNQLTCEIMSAKLKGINIPFYLLFRMMGWNTDKQIFDNILYGYDNDISKNMINYIKDAFNAKYTRLNTGKNIYNQNDAVRILIDELKYDAFGYLELDSKPENYQLAYKYIFHKFDIHFLPHIGIDSDSRDKKLKYLALVLRKIFLVHMGNMEPTSRDSYKSKRVHAAGTGYAKSFKTYFNASIIQQIKRRLLKDFKAMPFSQVDLAASVKSSVYGADFERSIIQSITSGNKSQITVNKRARTNRLSTQLLNRKNQLNVYSTLRQVSAPSTDSSKQSERANEMRRVHMSFMGYICIIHTPEGEKVGINKQIAIFASILGATSSEVLKTILLDDDKIMNIDKLNPSDIDTLKLNNVYVNGLWIGCVQDTLTLVNKYRQMRRELKINPFTIIYWDNTQDEAYFWTDVGRMVRPLIIVYNNKRDHERYPANKKYGKSKFNQGIGIDEDIITGLKDKTIDIEYLLRNNYIEYISPEEQENCYLCPNFGTLYDNKDNELHEYTHLDIPQAILGLTALVCPFANNNNTPRITFQTSQGKQTCGIFALNWPYRCDKDTFLQYNCEMPLVKTVTNKYLFPNGSNSIVAIMCNSGYNQEDSLVFGQGAVDRGLFNGCKFTYYKTELDQREEFGNPDITNTSDIKSPSYDNLTNGMLKPGVRVNKNDPIIGKYVRIIKNNNDEYIYSDRSTIYKDNEEAIIHNVINDRNEDDERFAKVIMRKTRPVTIGDKFSVKGTSEVLTDIGWIQIQNLNIQKNKVATLKINGDLEYVYPSGLSSYNYNGYMYYLDTPCLKLCVTENHKLYVKSNNMNYKLLRTRDVFGKHVNFKKNANNSLNDIKFFQASMDIYKEKYLMDAWLQFIGIVIASGVIEYNKLRTDICIKDDKICINWGNSYKKNVIEQSLKKLDVKFSATNVNCISLYKFDYPALFNEIKKIETSKSLPDYVWNMSQRQTCILLTSLVKLVSPHEYCSDNKALVDSITRLALHAGWSGTVRKSLSSTYRSSNIINPTIKIANYYNVHIEYDINKNEPEINNCFKSDICKKTEKYEHYKGKVFCLEIPDTNTHVYYSRDDSYSPPYWTGNSSRAGQKGVVGLCMRDSDMPFTKDGMRPSIIMNPHAIPSRMTIGQLNESHISNWCAAKGTHADATIFRKYDTETIAEELESMGLNRYGYHRLYNGITGEFIDCMIFMGPTYYQRLQKFVIDAVYSISHGPSDALTLQPLDGKSSGGGLRVGEMERDVLASHGVSRFIREKFFDHSDGYTEYRCRCGKPAIVNVKKNIYKCKYCKDNADIAAIPTSWSAKLFRQEMETMNIGIRAYTTPYTYETIQE
jgi:DNA-directed RNA polymerase beta subunit